MSLFTQLSALNAEDVVPEGVYVADRKDGTVPRWTVRARHDRAAGVVAILVYDPDPDLDLLDGPRHAATGILTCSRWTRRGPIRLLEALDPTAPETWSMNPMCSLDQQARRWRA